MGFTIADFRSRLRRGPGGGAKRALPHVDPDEPARSLHAIEARCREGAGLLACAADAVPDMACRRLIDQHVRLLQLMGSQFHDAALWHAEAASSAPLVEKPFKCAPGWLRGLSAGCAADAALQTCEQIDDLITRSMRAIANLPHASDLWLVLCHHYDRLCALQRKTASLRQARSNRRGM
jgi:hypothetical protein